MDDRNLTQLAQAVWIPLAVILATVGVLIFKAAEVNREGRAATSRQVGLSAPRHVGTSGTIGLAPVAVYDYLEFAGVIGPAPDVERAMSPSHDYTAEGLRTLAAALEAVAAEHPGIVRATVPDDLRAHAGRLQRDRHASHHAAIARQAFAAAADEIAALHPDAGIRLRRLANAMAADRPLLDQGEPVRTFFRESAEVLGTIAESRSPWSTG
jgi:hypothetical protein